MGELRLISSNFKTHPFISYRKKNIYKESKKISLIKYVYKFLYVYIYIIYYIYHIYHKFIFKIIFFNSMRNIGLRCYIADRKYLYTCNVKNLSSRQKR